MKTKNKISAAALAVLLIFTLALFAAACGEGDYTYTPPGYENPYEDPVSNDSDTGPKKSFKVVVPDGAPLAGITQMRREVTKLNGNTLTYEVEAESNLAARMTANTADFIIAPTNVGANVHSQTAGYKLAAATSWGMLYFVTTDHSLKAYDKNSNPAAAFLAQFEGRTIETIGRAAIPGKSVEYMLGETNVGSTLNGVSAPTDIVAKIRLNQSVVGVIAEPVLTTVTTSDYKDNCKVLGSVSDVYKEITGRNFPMAALFVKTSVIASYETTVSLFLDRLRVSIDFLNSDEDSSSNAETVAAWAANFGDSAAINAATFPAAVRRMNIAYKSAADSKADVKALLSNVGVMGVPDSLFM